jgi:hypothetical protein
MDTRAYSTICLKALDDQQRTFSGLATSPVPDRIDDVIEPLGCRYRNPLVLLRAHDHTMPIGEVHFDRPSKSGIGFRARIPTVTELGLLKDRLDMAWGEIRHGLIKAVSIGFRALESERLPSGGLRFTKTEIYELSTVAVPAQELATIDAVKSIDAAIRRGETPSAPQASSLWREIADGGQRSLDLLRGSPGFAKATSAMQMASEARIFGMEAVKALAAKVEELERGQSEPTLRYVGVWRSDRAYRQGDFVSHSGSLWHCNSPTDLRPGEGGGWQLAVKAGRDGKDAR